MTDSKKTVTKDVPQLPPLWSRTVFPDAQGIFTSVQKPLDQMKQDSIVILDANVLLLPYKMENVSLAEIVKVYSPLADAGRLIVPPQAAREFARHRSAKVGELVKYLREQASLSGPLLNKKIGALETHEAFKNAKELAERLSPEIRDLQKAILSVADDITGNVGDEPVSVAYRSLFAKAVCKDPPSCDDVESFTKDLNQRYAMSRPPGYKDQGKEDGGAGDLIIWQTILAEGKARNSDCVFVTADQKPDWYVQAGGPFQPRFELLDEYRMFTGKTLHIIPLSRLLKLFEASDEAVRGVRDVETIQNAFQERFHSVVRRRELMLLQSDLERTTEEIRKLENYLSNLPVADDSMALPWNRAARTARLKLTELLSYRQEITNELQLIDFAREDDLSRTDIEQDDL